VLLDDRLLGFGDNDPVDLDRIARERVSEWLRQVCVQQLLGGGILDLCGVPARPRSLEVGDA
jgi:hypothetical protein